MCAPANKLTHTHTHTDTQTHTHTHRHTHFLTGVSQTADEAIRFH